MGEEDGKLKKEMISFSRASLIFRMVWTLTSDLFEICTFRKYLILIVSEEVTEITPPPKEKVELIELDDQVDDVSQLARRFAISRHDHVHTITSYARQNLLDKLGQIMEFARWRNDKILRWVSWKHFETTFKVKTFCENVCSARYFHRHWSFDCQTVIGA